MDVLTRPGLIAKTAMPYFQADSTMLAVRLTCPAFELPYAKLYGDGMNALRLETLMVLPERCSTMPGKRRGYRERCRPDSPRWRTTRRPDRPPRSGRAALPCPRC